MQLQLTSARGITIIEVVLLLTATVAIVGALAPTMSATITNTRIARATTDAGKIRDAILAFKTDTTHGYFTVDGVKGSAERMELLVSDGDIPELGAGSGPWNNALTTSDRGFLEDHLILNLFGGASYPASGAGNIWRGAYLNGPVDPDPWGNRYAVNVEWLGNTGTEDTVVLSAGQDELIDTRDGEDALAAAGDDILVLVEA